MLQIAHTVDATEAEGPGLRMAIWFQGCPLRCPGCCNPEMLEFATEEFPKGKSISLDDLCDQILIATKRHDIEGITLLGGEPFAQATGASRLAQFAQSINLSVMIFTGFVLEDLRADQKKTTQELLNHTDLLVDGPYIREKPDSRRRWIGSTNQRVHFLTDRYHESDPCWRQTDTLEIRFHEGELAINGFPANQAKGIWKRSEIRKK